MVIRLAEILVLAIVLGCGSRSQQPRPLLPTTADSGVETTSIARDPTPPVSAVAVNSSKVPDGFPKQINVDEALAVIDHLLLSGQGCGGMTWEGKFWSMYSNDYKGETKTPWIDRPAKVSAMYAYGAEGHFLAAITIDQQEYRRNNRTEKLLTWKRDQSTER
jgi:hypothetical protein